MQINLETLKALKTTANDPSGDFFGGTKEELDPLIDAIVADSSLLGPMYLYFAAGTAIRLGRVQDAGLLFFEAQLRKAFEYKRFSIDTKANGSNAATYLAFLNHTAGLIINPAIAQDPKGFAYVIERLETWDVVPSPDVWEPEFDEAKGCRLKPSEWQAAAKEIKESFMTQYGRPMAGRLNNPLYFEAFQFVQNFNIGRMDRKDPANRQRYEELQGRMEAMEREQEGSGS